MKLDGLFKRVFWTCLLCLITSGSLFAIFKTWIRIQSTLGEVHHPAEQWIERAHTLLAFSFLGVFGYFFKIHVEPGLKNPRKRKMGVFLLLLILMLPCTALVILYANEGKFHDYTALAHPYIGLCLLPLILFHKRKEEN